MKETAAAAVGFLVASIVPVAILCTLGLLDGTYRIDSIVATFVVFYPFAAGFTIVLGLPAFFLLRPFRPGHWWSVLAAGFLLGVITSILLRLPGPPNIKDFFIDGPIGALSVLVFWLIWKRHAAKGDTN